MKIELNKPYNKDYKAGYIAVNNEPRRVLTLISYNGNRTSTSYARYLYSCHIGRYLSTNEHIDHIDNNQLNDDINNLQILTKAENNDKMRKRHNIKRSYTTLICPICNNEFTRPTNRITHKVNPTCSRKCGYKKMKLTNDSKTTKINNL